MSEAAAEFAATLSSTPMSVDEQLIRHSISIGGLVFREPETMPGYWSSVPRGIGDYLTWMADALERWDCTGRLPGLTRPLLAVVGGYDYACPMETWHGVLDGVGGCALEVFTESSHHPQVEEQTRSTRLSAPSSAAASTDAR
jgi:pimeloyl-ACP methyl ester carboxylesterase